LPANIWKEFPGQNVLPVIDDLYLGLAVGYDEVSGRWFTLSGYLVEKMFKLNYLCGWGYKTQLYPVPGILPCSVGTP
jgi:hypothetical protein